MIDLSADVTHHHVTTDVTSFRGQQATYRRHTGDRVEVLNVLHIGTVHETSGFFDLQQEEK